MCLTTTCNTFAQQLCSVSAAKENASAMLLFSGVRGLHVQAQRACCRHHLAASSASLTPAPSAWSLECVQRIGVLLAALPKVFPPRGETFSEETQSQKKKKWCGVSKQYTFCHLPAGVGWLRGCP